MEDLLTALKNNFNVSICTRTLENIDNSIYKHAMLGFKNLESYQISSLSKVLNSCSNISSEDNNSFNTGSFIKNMSIFN